ncbi:unnamed protein product, partial [Callosobruchus maculatus]
HLCVNPYPSYYLIPSILSYFLSEATPLFLCKASPLPGCEKSLYPSFVLCHINSLHTN